jgi:DNA mismatch repair protein MutS
MLSLSVIERYKALKQEYPNEILLYRVGIFYRIFFEDAVKASEVCGLKLMAEGEFENPIPVCGFPTGGLDKYVGKLVRAGCSVALSSHQGDSQPKVEEVIRV